MDINALLISAGINIVLIRVFSIAAVICLALVLPINYHGRDRTHKHIPFESLEVFTIENVKEGSTCHFTILVRSVPWSSEESYCETVKKFFSHYHSSAYLSHQMIYKSGKVQKLKDDAEHVCKVLKNASLEKTCKPSFRHCCSGASTNSFKKISNEMDSVNGGTDNTDMNLETTKKFVIHVGPLIQECAAAFVFFKSRYAALMAAKVLQTPNPMLWVTDLAPEPHDIYWSNICVPYRQLWIRKIATLVASIAFVFVFLIPVTFVQGLTQLDKLQKMFPFLRGLFKDQLSVFTSVTDLPAQLAKAVPSQRFILRLKEDALDSSISFPYHTEVPRVLLFGFLGFTCSILAPLMLPFLLFYFFLAYLVYRNQIINVYITKYDSGGQFWPIAHNTTVFSLIFSQLIAMGVFGLKRSTVASGFTIPLLIGTLLFHQYCRQRFLPIFKSNSAQIVIDMDMRDEHSGRMEEIYEHLPLAYSQPSLMEDASSQPQCDKRHEDMDRGQSSSEDMEKGKELFKKDRPRPVQRSVSLNSDKSVLGLNL
ncbi:CSC1-like protein [Vigna angularis]|uniref:CSC1-like protein n=1 Tax=Phaseolus angularis TaxID=3914 RepID=A0A8T0JZR2_PHAAN|nr:CSC1-like protein [Vigna angularis]